MTPEDWIRMGQLIKKIVKEELEAQDRRNTAAMTNAERQRRFRERHRNESNGSSEEPPLHRNESNAYRNESNGLVRSESKEERSKEEDLFALPIRKDNQVTGGMGDLNGFEVKRKVKNSHLMNGETLLVLMKDDTYKALDVNQEAGKFKHWCSANHHQTTKRRFINWLNRALEKA